MCCKAIWRLRVIVTNALTHPASKWVCKLTIALQSGCLLQVVAGQTAALALKKVKRNLVRKGMVLVGEASKPEATWEFDADIAILTHSTTIQPRYQAVIHCEIVRQVSSQPAEKTISHPSFCDCRLGSNTHSHCPLL